MAITTKKEPYTEKELSAMLGTEIRQSGNWTGSELREAIRRALDYFLLRKKGDEISGRSTIQSGEVTDIIDKVQAELQPLYNVDNLIEIKQEGPGDEEQAHAETEAINWYWRERLRGAESIDAAVQDGLVARNGYMHIFYEEMKGLPYEQELEGDRLALENEFMRMGANNIEIEVIEIEVTQEAEIRVVAQNPYQVFLPAGNQMPVVQDIEGSPAIYRAYIKCIPHYQEVKGEAVAPEDMFVSRDAIDSDMQKPRYAGRRRRMTRQDIKSRGFYGPDVDTMTNMNDWDEDVKTARQSDNNVYLRDASSQEGRLVDLFENYFKVDQDRDGVTEMWKIFSSATGDILHWDDNGEEGELAMEMVRVRPFASGSPMKLAHRHQGRSITDKEMMIEDAARQIKRQMLDNLVEANNVQTVWNRNSVNPEDIEETEVGRTIGADNPTADVVFAKHNNIVNDSLAALAWVKQEAETRGGTSLTQSGENMPVAAPAHTTERVMSAMERVVAMYARNFANSLIRDSAVLLHEQLKLLPGKIQYESGQEWAETEPRFWIQRNRITVNLGETEGEKMRKAAGYREVINIQREDAQGGMGILLDYDEMYEARIKWAAASGLSDVQSLWRDPNSEEAQMQMQQDAESSRQEAEMAAQQSQMLYQTQMALTQMQEQTKRMEAQMDMVNKERERLNKLIIEMTKVEADTGQEVPFGLLGETDQVPVVQ